MKKVLLIAVLGLGLKVSSQTTIEVRDSITNAVMLPGSCFTMATVPDDKVSRKFNITNTHATNTYSYDVKRYDIVLHSVPSTSTSAKAHFCFAGLCYGVINFISTSPLVLMAGTSATSIPGGYQLLYADLDEASSKGYSFVKYTVYNTNNPNDSSQFSIKYNVDCSYTGLKQNNSEYFGMEVSPNPVRDNAVLKVSSQKNEQAKVLVYNTLGAMVYESTPALLEGKNSISLQLQNLPAGIYFVELKTTDKTLTKKIILE